MSEDRIMLKNPNTGRDDGRIAVAMYEPVRDAILAALDENDELAYSALDEEVERRTPKQMWADASVAWYTVSVKLHLEATGMIKRHGSPHKLTLTDEGRAAIGD